MMYLMGSSQRVNDLKRDLTDVKSRISKVEEILNTDPNEDELLVDAKKIANTDGEIDVSLIEKKLSVDRSRASRIMKLLKESGMIKKNKSSM